MCKGVHARCTTFGIWVLHAPIAEHPSRSSRSCPKAIVLCTAKSVPATIGVRIRAFCDEKRRGGFSRPAFPYFWRSSASFSSTAWASFLRASR